MISETLNKIATFLFRIFKGKRYKRLERNLIRNQKKKIFFVSTYSTLSSMKQRPEHFFDEFISRGYDVFIFDRNIIRPIITAQQYWMLPFSYFKHLARNKRINKIIMSISTHDGIRNIEQHLLYCAKNGTKVIYEHLDDFDLYNSSPKYKEKLRSRFETLCKNENIIIVATADHLFNQAKEARGSDKNIYIVKNAVNPNDFNGGIVPPPPNELKKAVETRKPIVGYYGVISDDWFDYNLMNQVISQNKNFEFVFIGPMGGNGCEALKQHENLTYIPTIPYQKIPQYASVFNIAIIPFQLNEITKSTSPVKLFEYMALQKPIITTPLKECLLYKSCLIAHNAADFSDLLQKALTLQNDENYRRIQEQEVSDNTWSRRVDQLENALS